MGTGASTAAGPTPSDAEVCTWSKEEVGDHVAAIGDDRDNLTAIDLRITNESEYRAWDAKLNGIKAARERGAFGSINLLGPRSSLRSRTGPCRRSTTSAWMASRRARRRSWPCSMLSKRNHEVRAEKATSEIF